MFIVFSLLLGANVRHEMCLHSNVNAEWIMLSGTFLVSRAYAAKRHGVAVDTDAYARLKCTI